MYHEGLRTTGVYTVTDTFSHLDPVIVEFTLGGETIETTPEHPFYVLLRGWVDAGDLRPGMAVRQADGEYELVETVELEQRSQRMYNLTVAEALTFFVTTGGPTRDATRPPGARPALWLVTVSEPGAYDRCFWCDSEWCSG